MTSSHKLTIGILTYGQVTAPYLPSFLSSLLAQDCKDWQILVLDNSEQADNSNVQFLQDYPQIDYQWAGSNLGFAQGHNILIDKAIAWGAKYYLALNVDIILESDAISQLLKAMEADEKLGSVSPKVLRWDFAHQTKTKQIDSCGIKQLSGLHFIDLGQGQIDAGQYDQASILGPSGCIALYRLSALQQVKEGKNYYDPAFFMYKEDVDLACRLQLAGWQSKLVPTALIYHDRTIASSGYHWWQIIKARQGHNHLNKQYSFLGQLILFYKYWPWQNFWQKIIIISRLKIMLGYALFFERYLLGEWPKFKAIRPQLKRYYRK
ncbi:MAG: glycosyltransferase family 2 protein [bacterium]